MAKNPPRRITYAATVGAMTRVAVSKRKLSLKRFVFYGPQDMKDPAAVALGRKGGQARAAALTKAQRSAIAKAAADKRWANRLGQIYCSSCFDAVRCDDVLEIKPRQTCSRCGRLCMGYRGIAQADH